MKKFMTLIMFLTMGAGSLLVVVSCTTQTTSPNFTVPIKTVVGLNPTDTFTFTYTYTYTFTPTNTGTPTFTPTPFVTTTWPGILTFKHPSAIAVDSNSVCNGVAGPCVYVADTGNNKVEKYASNGSLVSSWGNSGKGKGSISISNPTGVAVDGSGNLFVVSSLGNVVNEYNSNGNYSKNFTAASGNFSGPQGVAVGVNGGVSIICISDPGNSRVVELNYSGALAGFGAVTVTPGSLSPVTIASTVTLAGVALNNNDSCLYVETKGAGINGSPFSTVLAFNVTSGAASVAAQGFSSPNGVAFDASGDLYVTDAGNGTNGAVDEFTVGNYLSQPLILGQGTLVDPQGVAVDANGNIYAVDYSAGNNGYGSVVLLAP